MRGVGNTVLEAAAIGDVPIISYVNGKAREGVLKDVLYVPGLGVNLYSIGKASALGIEIKFQFEAVDFSLNGEKIMSGQRVGESLYHLNITLKNSTTALMGISSAPERPCVISLELAHLRCVHLNYQTLIRQDRLGAVKGLKLISRKIEKVPCEGCVLGKMKRSPFPPGRTRATKVGEIIHVDTGLVPVPTVNGETCYANFKDDYSGWSVVKLMKKKSEIGEHLLAFIDFVETSTGKKVKIVRSDGAIELATNKLEQRFKELGIVHQKSCRHTPQQNSVVERDQRTSMEATRSTIYTRTNKWTNEFKNAPTSVKELWGVFLLSSNYVLNRTISSTSTKTPFELFFGRKPNLNNLRVIGCRAYAHVPDAIRKKLDAKATPCWLVGYGEATKGWILWDPVKRVFITSRDVTFNEKLLINDVPMIQGSQPTKGGRDPILLLAQPLGLVRKITIIRKTCNHRVICIDVFLNRWKKHRRLPAMVNPL